MKLLPELRNALKYPGKQNVPAFSCYHNIEIYSITYFMNIAFWEGVENHSLIKFLEFRLREGNLSDPKTEHRRYKEELNTITEYSSSSSEILEIVQKRKKLFKAN